MDATGGRVDWILSTNFRKIALVLRQYHAKFSLMQTITKMETNTTQASPWMESGMAIDD